MTGLIDIIISNWSQIVVGLTALYAAILSTFTYFDTKKAERQREEDRKPKVKVEIEKSVIITQSTGIPHEKITPKEFISIKATNIGEPTITITHFEYKLPKTGHHWPLGMLDERYQHNTVITKGDVIGPVMVEVSAIIKEARMDSLRGKVPIIGYCKDSLGNEYKSSFVEIDLGE